MNKVARLITAAILSFIMLWNGMPTNAMAEVLREVDTAALEPSEEVVTAEEASSRGDEQPGAVEVDQPDDGQPDADVEVDVTQPDVDSMDTSVTEAEASATDIESVDTAASSAQSADTEDDSDATPANDTESQPALMPAQTLCAHAPNGVVVTATVSADTLPAGTTLNVQPVDALTARRIGAQVATDNEEVVSVTAVDITFADPLGNEIEPANGNGVYVSMSLPTAMQGDVTVAHQDNDGSVETIEDTQVADRTATFTGTEFSVYAVVETTRIVTFNFYENAESTEPVRTQQVVANDYLYEPGPVAGADAGEKLFGWTVEGQSGPLAFDAQGRHIVTADELSAWAGEGNTVRVNAAFVTNCDVTFWGKEHGGTRDVFTRLNVAAGTIISAGDLPSTNTLLNEGEVLVGWSTDEGAATAAIAADFQDVTVSGPTSYYPVIATSHVIHFDANRMLGMAEDSAKGVKKLTVDYTPPQVVNAGSVTVEPPSEKNPKVEGGAFTFAGWYSDPECTIPFAWGETLDSDITLYAKWTPGTTTYRINVWKEKVSVLLGSEAHSSATVDPANFNFHKSIVVTNVPVLSGNEESGWAYNYVTVPDDQKSGVTTGVDKGFVYRTKDDQALLLADGTTEVNVYWNRAVAKTEFYVPVGNAKVRYSYESASSTEVLHKYGYYERYELKPEYTLEGLYEQPFSLYTNADGTPKYTWPEGAWKPELVTYATDSPEKRQDEPTYDDWVRPTGSIVRMRTHFVQPGVLADRYYLDPSQLVTTLTMHHILQGANGSWDVDNGATQIDIPSSLDVDYNIVNPYPSYFSATSYSIDKYCTDENDPDRKSIPSNKKLVKDEAQSGRYVYYTRSKFKVTFYTDASKQTKAFGPDQQYFEAPLGGYADAQYSLPDPASGEYTFGGWYWEPGETNPEKAIDWSKQVMPANDIEVYPIWVPNSVNVRIELGDNVYLNPAQSSSFWPDEGLGSKIDMQYLNAAYRYSEKQGDGADATYVRDNTYVLDGWYLPNNTYDAAWDEATEISVSLCDMQDGAVKKVYDDTYHNYYYTLTLRPKFTSTRAAKVRYHVGEGTGGPTSPSTDYYLYGSRVKVDTAIPTPPAGKVFLAWQDKVDASDATEGVHTATHAPGSTFAYNDEALVTTEGGEDYIDLTALYVSTKSPTATIVYHPNYAGGGNDKTSERAYDWNETITLPADTFTREGYELVGWSTKEIAEGPQDVLRAGDSVGVSAMNTDIDDVTNVGQNELYAVWAKVLTVEAKSQSKTYSGSEQEIHDFDTLSFTDGAETLAVSGLVAEAKGTDVGSYVGTVSGNAVVRNASGADVTWHYAVRTVPATLTITKAAITPTVAIEGWTYGDAASAPRVEGNAGNGAVTYHYRAKGASDDGWSTTVPTEAGTYEIKATIAASANYEGAETAPVEFAIAQRTVGVVPTPGQSKAYGATDPAFAYTVDESTPLVAGHVMQGALGRETGEDAGTYAYTVGTLRVSDGTATGSNYAVELAEGTFQITKAAITPTVSIEGWTYGGAANTPSVAGNTGNAAVTYQYKVAGADDSTYTDVVPTGAGSYTIRASVAETDNYQSATATADFVIAKASQSAPTAATNGASSKTAADGSLTITSDTAKQLEYSADNGSTWQSVTGGSVGFLAPGTYLVRYAGNDNFEPSPSATAKVGYAVTGRITWHYAYSYTAGGAEQHGRVNDTATERSKSAIVRLMSGSTVVEQKVVNATGADGDVEASSGADTYTFQDLELDKSYNVAVTPTVATSASDPTQIEATAYTATMTGYDCSITYTQECFSAPWRVDVKGVSSVDAVIPDTVYVKVLYGITEAGVGEGYEGTTYQGYAVISQQVDGHGVACALSGGSGDVAYTTSGSYPVWKYQPGGTNSYFHKAIVVGYTVGGTFIDCTGKNYVSEGAMTYTGSGASNTMVITINSLDIPVLEFNANGSGATAATPYVLGDGYGSTIPAATITGNVATWDNHVFAGWYGGDGADKPTGGTRQETDLTLNGKTTLYAHWTQNQDAPAGLTTTKASNTATATISGVTGAMEYSTNDGSTWTKVSGTDIADLSAGQQVQVRYAATDATADAWPKNASPATTITIQAKDTQDAPVLVSTKAGHDTSAEGCPLVADGTVAIQDYDASKPALYKITHAGGTTSEGSTDTAPNTVFSNGVFVNLAATDVVEVCFAETDDSERSEYASATPGTKDLVEIAPTLSATSSVVTVTNAQAGVRYELYLANAGDGANSISGITAIADSQISFDGCDPHTTYEVRTSVINPDTSNYDYACKSATITTQKADFSLSSANLPEPTDSTYNRQAQALVTAPTSLPNGCSKVQYSLHADGWDADTAIWNDDVPTGVDAGTYQIHVKYVGDDGHNDLVYNATIDATIGRRSIKTGYAENEGDPTSMAVLAIPARFVYSGEAQGPTVTVYDHATILKRSIGDTIADYTVSYGTAVSVGTYSLTVTGTGNYKDSVEREFAIVPYKVGANDKLVVDLGTDDYTYNGSVQKPRNVTVSLNGAALVEGVDYDLAYTNDRGEATNSIDAGGYQVTVTLKGNYEGSTAKGYSILPKQITADDVAATPTEFVYNGSPQGPTFGVTSQLVESKPKATLTKNTDYLLTGNTATGVGTYTATISGTGNFTGTVTKQFIIKPYAVGADDRLEVSFEGGNTFVYNGTEQKPSNVVVKLNGTPLAEGTDYSLAWPDSSVNAGTYQAQITLGENYVGEKNTAIGYTITPKPITAEDVALSGVDGLVYDNTSKGPSVSVTSTLVAGGPATTLAANTDYVLAGNEATDAGTHTFTVTGVGNFCGTVAKDFTIQTATATIQDANRPQPTANVYNGSAQDLLTAPATLPEGYVKAQYSVDGGQSWTDDVPTGVDAGAYNGIQVRYVGDKNHENVAGTAINGSIALRKVTFTGESGIRVFTGVEQELTGVTVGGEHGLVSGHTYELAYSAKGTNAGSYPGTIDAATDVVVRDAAGTDVTSNYEVLSTQAGSLTIGKAPLADTTTGTGLLANESKRPITVDGVETSDLTKQVPLVKIVGAGDSVLYDGQDHVPAVVDAVTGEAIDPSTYAIAYFSVNEDGTRGAELTGDDAVAATKDAGQKIAVATFNETSPNFTQGSCVSARMDIRKRTLSIAGESASVVYDGEQHTLDGIAFGGDGLADGHTSNVTKYEAKGKDKGAYPGVFNNDESFATGSVRVTSGGDDVTANYEITLTPGNLVVGAQRVEDRGDGKGYADDTLRVSVEFAYGGGVYDGLEHAPTATDALKDERMTEGIDYTVAYYHASDIYDDGSFNEDATPLDAIAAAKDKVAIVTLINDFTGTVVVGAPVAKRPLELVGNSGTKAYTGKEQSVAGFSVAGTYPLVEGQVAVADARAEGTDAGSHAGTISAAGNVVVRDAAGIDVTSNYSVTTKPGKLTINPVPLRVVSGSASKPYDGTPLTKDEATVTGLVDGQTIRVTVTGSQTKVGSSQNAYTVQFAGEGRVATQAVDALTTQAEGTGIAATGANPTAKRGNYVLSDADDTKGVLEVTAYDAGANSGKPNATPAKAITVTPGAKPVITDTRIVGKDGKPVVLKEGVDYTVAYYDANGNKLDGAPTSAGTYKMVVTYAGNYTGTYETNFTIGSSSGGTTTDKKNGTTNTQKSSSTTTPASYSSGAITGSTSRTATADTGDTSGAALPVLLAAAAMLLVGLRRRLRG